MYLYAVKVETKSNYQKFIFRKRESVLKALNISLNQGYLFICSRFLDDGREHTSDDVF